MAVLPAGIELCAQVCAGDTAAAKTNLPHRLAVQRGGERNQLAEQPVEPF